MTWDADREAEVRELLTQRDPRLSALALSVGAWDARPDLAACLAELDRERELCRVTEAALTEARRLLWECHEHSAGLLAALREELAAERESAQRSLEAARAMVRSVAAERDAAREERDGMRARVLFVAADLERRDGENDDLETAARLRELVGP